jgi:apolipoprotein N-acyltransferase
MAVWRALTKPIRYAALLAGALPVLAFPAANLAFLAWFGLVPGLLIMRAAASAREAAVRGWWFGAGFILAAHYWLAPNIGPALLLVAIVLGALWMPVAVSTWLLLRPPAGAGEPGSPSPAGPGTGGATARAAAALLVVPSWWLVVEWIRSWQALGGPWALLGVSQWQHPAVLGLAAAGGVWLVSFAIVAANTGIVILLTGGHLAIRALGAAAVAVAVAAGPAVFALLPPPHPTRFLTVALVQPGQDPGPDASQRLSAALASRHPGLIVWGESSVDSDIARSPGLRARLTALSTADGAQILADQDTVIGGKKSKTAVLVGPRGIVASYTKTRLVPFGEYIPFRQQLGWLTKISRAAPVNMVPGPGAQTMRITAPGGRRVTIGVLICFESAFPDMSRVDARRGAQLIAYQTSDSTFQLSWAPAQHASLGAVRAAETGRPVVQAALTGDSVAFDAQGRLLARLTTGQRGVLIVRLGLAPAAALTPFDRIGEVVPWTAIGIAALSVLLLIYQRRRHRPVTLQLDVNPRPVPSVSTVGTLTDREAGPGPTGRGEGSASSSQSGR